MYAVLACAAVTALWSLHALTGTAAFVAYAVPAAITSLPSLLHGPSWKSARSNAGEAFEVAWPHARWSFLGALVSWLQTNAYIYVPLAIGGAKPVGLLAAARLTMTPISLLLQAWPNLIRPVVSRRIAQQPTYPVTRFLLQTSAIQLGGIVLYAACVIVLLEHAPMSLIPSSFRSALPDVRVWAVVFAVQGLRVNVACFLQASLDFYRLFVNYAIAAAAAVTVAAIAALALGPMSSLLGVLTGEIVLLILLGLQFRKSRSGFREKASARS
jgi:O-antigen/teichoic acid export membrane protein